MPTSSQATQPTPHCDTGPERREEDRGVDERERQPVVEPGLAGQGEAHLVVLVDLLDLALEGRPLHLHVRGEHRVGRRQGGAEQHGGRGGHPERTPREQGDAADGQRHRDAEQPPGRRPRAPRLAAAPAQRPVEGQAHAHQRDEHGDLGDVLDDRAGRDRVELDVGQRRQQPDRHAGGHEHDRRRQRPAVQQLREDGGQEQGPPEQEVDQLGLSRGVDPDVPEVVAQVVQAVLPEREHGELRPVRADAGAPPPVGRHLRVGRRERGRPPRRPHRATVAGSCSP